MLLIISSNNINLMIFICISQEAIFNVNNIYGLGGIM